ncbi:MAG: glutamate synthase large subunit [Solirubrobacteraceae bacterium]|nr:MAG: glutamate synthase large subunit [Solirubrobacterales bacterium]
MQRSSLHGPPGGLYDPSYEHDACGVAFVARLRGGATHDVVRRGLTALNNLEHRGAEGADPRTGDGAGLLIDMPDDFLRASVDFELPERGRYGVATCFLPRDPHLRAERERVLREAVEGEGQRVLGWRDIPVQAEEAGATAQACAPMIRQLFVGLDDELCDERAVERKLYVIRRVAELRDPELAIPSFSSRTLVYKGMLKAPQLQGYFPDLADPRLRSRFALVHSRFSTNTFPSWELAHPYRMIAHNGEINTLRGNLNWMRARELQMRSALFGADLPKLLPLLRADNSDSATLDNVVELLTLGGRSLPHAMMMLIPEAYGGRDDVAPELRGFYDYHAGIMEPWDGPAAVAFTDAHYIGATLDRNGLRPGRWALTKDGYVVLASEAGVLDLDGAELEAVGRLRPGKLFLVDLDAQRIVPDEEIKLQVATQAPYGEWYERCSVVFEDLPETEPRAPRTEPVRARQLAFGYSEEDLRVLLGPMARDGAEPNGSMGNDLALAVLSDHQPALFSYFKQLFAQVTNPAIDSIRESIVMSLSTAVGPEGNLLSETPEHAHQLTMRQPILRNAELEKLRQVSHDVFRSATVDITWLVSDGAEGMDRALARVCLEAADLVAGGTTILILSDRNVGAERAPIPSLLAVSAVHHHLVKCGTRLRAGLVIESGEPREIHHFATLIGYGASAVNPYLLFESLADLVGRGTLPGGLSFKEADQRLVTAIGKGLLKTMSKMGISTIESYCGAQIFEAVGLDPALIERHFTGTPSRVGGVGIDVLAREALERHRRGYPGVPPQSSAELLPSGGVYAWRRDGEHHIWNPETVAALQHAVRGNGDGQAAWQDFSAKVDQEAARRASLRGLLQIREDREPIPVEQVEPAEEIVKRFATGAMSLGSISRESHESLAVAMNRIGGKSNTGEGGEDPERYHDERRSSIKQVASGRFGVTIDYLVNADELQIKVAQGAKPGEGGQLPGHKVSDYIGKLRHSVPGVGLISPPPHHDIYSIEDLKQLIYDLRCANPSARVSVKLVAEVGVGTVAAGVAKANADHVTIAGHDGGTGASPLSSIQSAGVPWEIGLAETQQTLVANDLRSRITVQADGQMKTGRDVIIAGLLGADEMGFSTAPLIAMGCIMMRVCHLNTCPVGIATQNEELRRRFTGTPDHVIRYFFLVAEEVRGIMASLGIARFSELIGRVDLLRMQPAITHWKALGVDLSLLLTEPSDADAAAPRRRLRGPEPVLEGALDHRLIEDARGAIAGGDPVTLEYGVRNTDRTVGGLLSGEIARQHGARGLPPDSIVVRFYGSAGQSFGAWLAPGVTITLLGEANDYVGKGLSGGVLAVRPPETATFAAEDNVIVGNTVLYGATAGRAYFRGLAGERFGVRNSGVSAVVEGVGDHGCEYMTGGEVVVLGPTGRNFAAGMSGGVAFVWDPEGRFPARCNRELVDFEEMDAADRIELYELVKEHRERTASTVAGRLLEDWDAALTQFVKVMPRDYKQVLVRRAELAARGETQGEAERAAVEGTR